MNTLTAVILAGGSAEALDPTVAFKGLVPIAGKPMVEWIIDAMSKAKTVDHIIAVVPTDKDLGQWTDLVDEIVVSKGSFAENALKGVKAANTSQVLVCTGDIPALTSEAIDDFVERTQERDAAWSYALISHELMERQFPHSQRSYFKLDNTQFTGGNLMVVSTEHADELAAIAQDLFEVRKNALKIAAYAGPSLLIKLAAGRLTIADAEAKATKILGGKFAAIQTPYASLGVDVDKPYDIAIAEAHIGPQPVLDVTH